VDQTRNGRTSARAILQRTGKQVRTMRNDQVYDCIIIGAGPGGLQGAIHLARYNRRVMLIDRGGGRTRHARHIVNYLGFPAIEGLELTRIGFRQGTGFGVTVKSRTEVTRLSKRRNFKIHTAKEGFLSRFVIAASGAQDILPKLKNLGSFFGRGFYTCVDCDGHLTTDTDLLVMADNINGVRLALAMKKMFTDRLVLLLDGYAPPPDILELLREDRITVIQGTPAELLGREQLAGVRLTDDRALPCQTIMASYGWRLNDGYLRGLNPDRDANGFKILTNSKGETSLPGLYATGALCSGHSQAIIAAGQGAVAAIDINARLLEL
jgi:thioredoxin reductase (NADPH)